MKARRKGFDIPFREIETLTMKGTNGVYFADDLEFEQQQEPTSDHWQELRERAAIAAMQGVMNFFGSIDYNRETIAELAYNVGPYRILGNRTKYPKSTLLKKIEAGNRDFKDDYVQFCHWKGKKIPSIERRRYAELLLLYIP